ncbi:ArsR/SmtB family transcription factor [Pelagirhabdus alkalitolerans]|nr:metalloregulator ArsR/SmtB family transcription factor [Pelagirhabdus alkalitolerans]
MAKLLKVLSDKNRLKIIDLLSCGERCACDLLEAFEFTQPTLSHHLKVLADYQFIKSRKEGVWYHYRLNPEMNDQITVFLSTLLTPKASCICHDQTICQCQNEKERVL